MAQPVQPIAATVIPIVMLDGRVRLYAGDCRDSLRALADNSIDSVVCDPPYALVSIVKRFGKPGSAPAVVNEAYARASAGFMGKAWDTGEVAFAADFWEQVLRVLKPGGHVVAFSGTRTYHRMAVAIEDAGFEIRDQLAWVYGSGFPKSHDVSKAIDKAAGVEFTAKPASGVGFMGADGPGGYNPTVNQLSRAGESTDAARQWQGWGTALKPAWEPICMARKPITGTVAANVLENGTGALNVDGCRVGNEGGGTQCNNRDENGKCRGHKNAGQSTSGETFHGPNTQGGRWPANIIHDGSDEVVACFPNVHGAGSARTGSAEPRQQNWIGNVANAPADRSTGEMHRFGDSGSAARFFYSAKADATDRMGSKHPTVKPVDLMQWLCRLVTPPGGTILDPFAGSGSTGEAAWREGFSALLCEREPDYIADIQERMRLANVGPMERRARVASRKVVANAGPLFGEPANDNGGGRQIYGKFADQQPGWRRDGR